MIGRKFRRFGWKSALLINILMLCACTAQPQPELLNQQTATANQVVEYDSAATPTASHTPQPAPTFTKSATMPRAAPQTPSSRETSQEAGLIESLREGGYVIYIHSKSQNDTDAPGLEECPQKTNLSEQSQIDARVISASFLALGIPVSQVLHSESCSSHDAAMIMFGRGENWADMEEVSIVLRGERIAALRQILSTPPHPGTNNVFVGHGPDIADVTGITFEEGETVIYKPLGNVGYSFVKRILPEMWDELKRNIADLVKIERYVSNSIPLEKIEPTHEPHNTLQSGSHGNIQIPPTGSTDQELLLPDLTTLPPTDLRIRINSTTGQKLLRFTNSIMNFGPGNIELYGETNPETGRITVTQYIFRGGGATEDIVVGEFFFHPEHDHWHLGDFARYEILSLGLDGELDSVVALSNKVSYCLRDDERSAHPNAPSGQTYTSCDNEIQGISVGWIDIYRQHLPGQSIDITALPDGVYALRSTVDPENSLRDKNPENNTAILYIEIENHLVKIIEPSDIMSNILNNQN